MLEPTVQDSDNTPAKQRTKTPTQRAHASSVYDLAIFLGNSLGPALPFIVVIGLVTFRAFWGIGKMTDFQTKLNKAQQELNAAKFAQKEAEDKEANAAQVQKIKSLQDNEKTLNELNDRSTKVSAAIQDIVSKQIESMKQTSDFSQDQLKLAKAELADVNTKSETLKKQIESDQAELAKVQKARQQDSALGAYNETLEEIRTIIAAGNYLGYEPILRLGRELNQNEVISDKARSDLADQSKSWGLRAVLALMLYRKSTDPAFLKQAEDLITQNHAHANHSVPSVFDIFGLFDATETPELVPMLVRFLCDHDFSFDFRITLAESQALDNPAARMALPPAAKRELALLVGRQLVLTNSQKSSTCLSVEYMLKQLADVSPEAQLVYATRIKDNLMGISEEQVTCIRQKLDLAIAGQTPTPAQLQQWP